MAEGTYSRRQVLAGGIGGAAALRLARTRHVRATGQDTVLRAAQAKAAGSDLGAVKHVVFLMQENRSFDHYFGTMKRVTGFNDAANRGAFTQAWPGGSQPTLLPFHMNTKTQQAECTYDLDHSWPAEHASWNNRGMDKFVATHTSARYEGALGINTMGYYTKADLPCYYSLAQKFTVCDHYFCSVLGPTHPNRLMQISGTIDPAGVASGPVLTTNSSLTAFAGTCSWTTMPEVPQSNGISWKTYNPYGPNYQPGASFFVSKNMLLYFQQYLNPASPLYQNAFGYTVPMIVVSPFSAGGYVCSDVFDHTSQLRFLETLTGVAAPNISSWRRSVTGGRRVLVGSADRAEHEGPALRGAQASEDAQSVQRVAQADADLSDPEIGPSRGATGPRGAQPPEMSWIFCLPAVTKGIMARSSAPTFSIGWSNPAWRSAL